MNIRNIVKSLLPPELYYELSHLKNRKKYEKEIRQVKTKVGTDGEKYTYTLKDFEEIESIFVHIPKAAGGSILKALFGHWGGGHKSVKEYRKIFGYRFWSYFKFTFVRNPYVRLVSAYEYLRRGGHPAWPEDKRFGTKVIKNYRTFSEFVKGQIDPSKDEWKRPHFYPQTSFLEMDNEIVVDFIGNVETIERDFENVCEVIGVNVELPHKNKTSKEDRSIQSFYVKDEVIRRVRQVYRLDFEKLGYSQDISEAHKPPSKSQSQ